MKGEAVNVTREQTPRCQTDTGVPPLSPSFGDKGGNRSLPAGVQVERGLDRSRT